MTTLLASGQEVSFRVLEHLLGRLESTPVMEEPFPHFYLEEVFPPDLYEDLLRLMPDPGRYDGAGERHNGMGGAENARSSYRLTSNNLASLSAEQQELWRGTAAALTAPEWKQAVFTKLRRDLAFRYGVPEAQAHELAGFARPTLFRETEGFEIPPHPDTRKKIVTMHLYLPADHRQLDLGTALYRRRLLAWPFAHWQSRFTKVKQFPFQPNSGYAFVVNNTLMRKSWHGRETLPADAGVRNTLMNTFYEHPRKEFEGYLPSRTMDASSS